MSAANPFEIGIFTFGELTRNAEGQPMDAATRMRDILEWARVADEAGLDVFGVGSTTARTSQFPPLLSFLQPLPHRRRTSG